MDARMSEEIRIGVVVMARLDELRQEQRRQGFGGWLVRKDGTASLCGVGWFDCIEQAGGIDRLFTEWKWAA